MSLNLIILCEICEQLLLKCLSWDSIAFAQSSVIHSRAAPRRIQKSGCFSVGKCKNMTKLVEWPVVDSSPWRIEVLYMGQWKFLLMSRVTSRTGSSQMTGKSMMGTPICESSTHILRSSQRAPWMNRPWIWTPVSGGSVTDSNMYGYTLVLKESVSIA